MPIFIDEAKTGLEPKYAERPKSETKPDPRYEITSPDDVPALVQLLRNRSYAEIRERMYDSAPASPWWTACRTELDLRNGQQMAEASLAMSRVSEKTRSSVQHFEQLADTLQESTSGIADLLRGTQEAARRLEIAVYVVIGVTLVQFFNLVFEVFRKH